MKMLEIISGAIVAAIFSFIGVTKILNKEFKNKKLNVDSKDDIDEYFKLEKNSHNTTNNNFVNNDNENIDTIIIPKTKKKKNNNLKINLKEDPIPFINKNFSTVRNIRKWMFYLHNSGDLVSKNPKCHDEKQFNDSLLYNLYKKYWVINLNNRLEVIGFLQDAKKYNANEYYINYLEKIWKIDETDYDVYNHKNSTKNIK